MCEIIHDSIYFLFTPQVRLLDGSVILRCAYPDGKRELQAMALFAARLPAGAEVAPDEEAAGFEWVRTADLAATTARWMRALDQN